MPETETKSSSMICTKRKIDFTDNPLSYDYKKTKESCEYIQHYLFLMFYFIKEKG